MTLIFRKRTVSEEAARDKAKKSKKKKNVPNEKEQDQKQKSRQLTEKFKRVKEKIHKLERLTPTWDWNFEVEKNSYNSRDSKHKFTSATKASDLPKRTVTDRISRIFKECLNEVKNIEEIDQEFKVTLKALKPESESTRKNIHDYMTKTGDEAPPEDSQGSHLGGGGSSEELLTSQEVADDEISTSCRYCRDEIFLQDTRSYVACLKPAGRAHFAAHFACLGLFPTSKMERIDIRSIYSCPVHR